MISFYCCDDNNFSNEESYSNVKLKVVEVHNDNGWEVVSAEYIVKNLPSSLYGFYEEFNLWLDTIPLFKYLEHEYVFLGGNAFSFANATWQIGHWGGLTIENEHYFYDEIMQKSCRSYEVLHSVGIHYKEI